ncbi:hypothetical protein TNIN_116411 [Trichonephila inaurata madagascariensis]|uniref:Uncharacterized protein n=1 Tax=Trichonephila inaurata madagascariensis TaxID=2747483 RepID=A0A8X6YET4_9ARAC|nr:hypothetical protein TNIN_116411 [Trichonephila inaurata madagascariensis]
MSSMPVWKNPSNKNSTFQQRHSQYDKDQEKSGAMNNCETLQSGKIIRTECIVGSIQLKSIPFNYDRRRTERKRGLYSEARTRTHFRVEF